MSTPQLQVGRTVDERDFTLPLEVMTYAMAIHGVRGRGKTVTASVIVEELLKARQQVVIIDPTDVWWGLKSSLDGKGEGFPVVILGGFHGDLPLDEGAGAALAEFAVGRRASMILSLRHLSKTKQRRFVADFAEHLYHLKGEPEARTPLFLAIDEASQFVPQRVHKGQERMVGAIDTIVRLGRASGLGVALIDQRPATVNKDSLSQVEVLVAHGLTGKHDRKAIDDWIQEKGDPELRDAFLSALPSLPQGEALIWAPLLEVFEHVRVRMRETFDSSKTPKPGEAPPVPETLAEVDLEALGAELREAVAQAEANDPKKLRAQIQELERDLEEAEQRSEFLSGQVQDLDAAVREARADVGPEEIEERVAEALDDAVARAVTTAADRIQATVDEAYRRAKAAESTINETLGAIDEVALLLDDVREEPPPAPAATPGARRERRPRPRVVGSTPAAEPRAIEVTDQDPELTGPQRKILGALAKLEALGLVRPDKSQVGAFSGYSPKSSTFRTYMGQLSTADLVTYPSPGLVSLTDAGRKAAGRVETPPTLEDLHAAWFGILDGPRGKLLTEVIRAHPRALTNEKLAERSGYSAASSTFRTYRGTLSSLGLIEYPEPGVVQATPLLFPEGLQ